MQKINFKISSILVLLSFFGIVFFELFTTLAGYNPNITSIEEKREQAQFPEFTYNELKKYPHEIEKYLIDNFGFRNLFISYYTKFRHFVLKADAVDYILSEIENKTVVEGNEDWLVYVAGNMRDYQNLDKLSESEIENIAMNLQYIADKLHENRIDFLFMMPPNTPSIYPESIPNSVKILGQESRYDQIFQALSQRTNISFIDLKKLLLENKGRELLYYKTDSHWNTVGAFLAYRELMTAIQKLYPNQSSVLVSKPISEFNLFQENYSGDLAKMLGLKDVLTEKTPTLMPKRPFQFPKGSRKIL